MTFLLSLTSYRLNLLTPSLEYQNIEHLFKRDYVYSVVKLIALRDKYLMVELTIKTYSYT